MVVVSQTTSRPWFVSHEPYPLSWCVSCAPYPFNQIHRINYSKSQTHQFHIHKTSLMNNDSLDHLQPASSSHGSCLTNHIPVMVRVSRTISFQSNTSYKLFKKPNSSIPYS